jgi:stearoyl-CoA desaturase (delta-9 desaturase)
VNPPTLAAARRLDWRNIVFLIAAHLLGLAAVAYLIFVRASPWTIALGLLWFALCGVSITGGYHRLFSHKAYSAHPLVRAFYLFFGAAAAQNSALKWSRDHRLHHKYTDLDLDPYAVKDGFVWAHIGWILYRDTHGDQSVNARDLTDDALVRWQDRWYVPLAVLAGIVLPAAIGIFWGDPLGALLVCGFLRLIVQWHATFCVNSLAHTIGTQPYDDKTSARDSFITAIVTLGEGYHNFHHRFQADYRNGVRWYQFDPTKWFVWVLSCVGLTSNLRRTPPQLIAQARAR